MTLADLGWDAGFATAFEPWAQEPHLAPGRVVIAFNYIYRLYAEDGEFDAVLSGRFKHHAVTRSELPAVGDWVAARRRPGEERGTVVGVLPRRSRFSRRVAGTTTDEQVVAANVDVLFLVMALDGDFSVRRIERYLLLARESGASAVVLLTKPDLSADLPAQLAAVCAVAGDAAVHVLAPKIGEGIGAVVDSLPAGRTGALLGSSGVGKTTIINRLLGGDARRTQDVRASDSKGRHTTTHRELVILPGGGLVIDTPGMRELQLWEGEGGVREAFDDVERLAADCHFSDCAHRDEPKCAVKAAVTEGRLDGARLESYLKLQDELTRLARQQDERALIEEKRRGRIGAKALRAHLKTKRP